MLAWAGSSSHVSFRGTISLAEQLPVGSPHLSSVRSPVLTSVLFLLWPRICHIIKAIVNVSTSALGFETLGDRHGAPGLARCLACSRRARSAVWMPGLAEQGSAPQDRQGAWIRLLSWLVPGPLPKDWNSLLKPWGPRVARPPAGTKAVILRQEGEWVRPLI